MLGGEFQGGKPNIRVTAAKGRFEPKADLLILCRCARCVKIAASA